MIDRIVLGGLVLFGLGYAGCLIGTGMWMLWDEWREDVVRLRYRLEVWWAE